MKKFFNLRERTKDLRKSKGMTQDEFAKKLRVSKSTISGWEKGYVKIIPPDALIRLGNLAAYEECMDWWEAGGLDEHAMLSAAENRLRDLGKALPGSKFVQIRPLSRIRREGAGKADPILLPAKLVPNPGSTAYIELGKNSVGRAFVEGDILVVDSFESRRDPMCPEPFWERLIVVEMSAASLAHPSEGRFWREGIVVGRLQLVLVKGFFEGIAWVAQLHLSEDVNGEGPVVVGKWAEISSPEDARQLDLHDQKTEDRILQESEERAYKKLRLYDGCEIVGEVILTIPAKAKRCFHFMLG